MHYYRFNIADYRKQTAHLTLIEHAIYRSLLDTYYLTENPLDGDLNTLMRSHCIRTEDEKQALQNVLNDFFLLKDGNYHNDRCDEELRLLYAKSEKARKSAKARWLKKQRERCERNANG